MIFTYCKNDTKQTSLFNKIPTGLVENKNKIPTYWVENKNFSQNFVFALKKIVFCCMDLEFFVCNYGPCF
jgi:hypothetical protein